jgi:hypothetical protein
MAVALLLALGATCHAAAQQQVTSLPANFSVPREVFARSAALPPWQLLDVENPHELMFEVRQWEPERGAVVVRPRAMNNGPYFAATGQNDSFRKVERDDGVLEFRIYLAFTGNKNALHPSRVKDGRPKIYGENRGEQGGGVRFANLGVSVTMPQDGKNFFFKNNQGRTVIGSRWIEDPEASAFKYALLLLAEGDKIPSRPVPIAETPTLPTVSPEAARLILLLEDSSYQMVRDAEEVLLLVDGQKERSLSPSGDDGRLAYLITVDEAKAYRSNSIRLKVLANGYELMDFRPKKSELLLNNPPCGTFLNEGENKIVQRVCLERSGAAPGSPNIAAEAERVLASVILRDSSMPNRPVWPGTADKVTISVGEGQASPRSVDQAGKVDFELLPGAVTPTFATIWARGYQPLTVRVDVSEAPLSELWLTPVASEDVVVPALAMSLRLEKLDGQQPAGCEPSLLAYVNGTPLVCRAQDGSSPTYAPGSPLRVARDASVQVVFRDARTGRALLPIIQLDPNNADQREQPIELHRVPGAGQAPPPVATAAPSVEQLPSMIQFVLTLEAPDGFAERKARLRLPKLPGLAEAEPVGHDWSNDAYTFSLPADSLVSDDKLELLAENTECCGEHQQVVLELPPAPLPASIKRKATFEHVLYTFETEPTTNGTLPTIRFKLANAVEATCPPPDERDGWQQAEEANVPGAAAASAKRQYKAKLTPKTGEVMLMIDSSAVGFKRNCEAYRMVDYGASRYIPVPRLAPLDPVYLTIKLDHGALRTDFSDGAEAEIMFDGRAVTVSANNQWQADFKFTDDPGKRVDLRIKQNGMVEYTNSGTLSELQTILKYPLKLTPETERLSGARVKSVFRIMGQDYEHSRCELEVRYVDKNLVERIIRDPQIYQPINLTFARVRPLDYRVSMGSNGLCAPTDVWLPLQVASDYNGSILRVPVELAKPLFLAYLSPSDEFYSSYDEPGIRITHLVNELGKLRKGLEAGPARLMSLNGTTGENQFIADVGPDGIGMTDQISAGLLAQTLRRAQGGESASFSTALGLAADAVKNTRLHASLKPRAFAYYFYYNKYFATGFCDDLFESYAQAFPEHDAKSVVLVTTMQEPGAVRKLEPSLQDDTETGLLRCGLRSPGLRIYVASAVKINEQTGTWQRGLQALRW